MADLRSRLSRMAGAAAVCQASAELASSLLSAQAATIYLWTKRGAVERFSTSGTDGLGNPITDQSLRSAGLLREQHTEGTSFTGRTLRRGPSGFGEPCLVQSVKAAGGLDPQLCKCYESLLGRVQTAASVPLNGRAVTFGVLEVVNRIPSGEFGVEDLRWLQCVADEAASALSLLRQELRARLLLKLAERVANASLAGGAGLGLYQDIARGLVHEDLPYAVAVIRIVEGDSLVERAAAGATGFSLEDRRLGGLPSRHMLAGRAFRDRSVVYEQDIRALDPESSGLVNSDWARAQGLVSYVCVPLQFEGEVYGTLSLYYGYHHSLFEYESHFLKTMASLLAAYTMARRRVGQLREDESLGTRSAIQAAFDALIAPKRHDYSDFLRLLANKLAGVIHDNTFRQLPLLVREIESERQRLLDEFSAAEPEIFDLNHLLQEAVASRRRLSHDVYIKFELDLDSTIPPLRARSAGIRYAILDLLNNSIKAIEGAKRSDGSVRVSTREVVYRTKSYVEVLVVDTGSGIPREQWEAVFERGFSTRGGSGLGLFLGRLALTAEGGRLEVLESTVGEGTTMQLLLPERMKE